MNWVEKNLRSWRGSWKVDILVKTNFWIWLEFYSVMYGFPRCNVWFAQMSCMVCPDAMYGLPRIILTIQGTTLVSVCVFSHAGLAIMNNRVSLLPCWIDRIYYCCDVVWTGLLWCWLVQPNTQQSHKALILTLWHGVGAHGGHVSTTQDVLGPLVVI